MHPIDGHTVCFSSSSAIHHGTLTAFISSALERREAVFYLSHNQDDDAILANLRRESESVDAALDKGQLVFSQVDEVIAKTGDLNIDETFAWTKERCEEMLSRGYPAISVFAEMTWAVEEFSPDMLMVFEGRFHEFVSSRKCYFASHYSLDRVDSGQMIDIARTSKRIGIDGETFDNPFYSPVDILTNKQSAATLFRQMTEVMEERHKKDTLLEGTDILKALFREIDEGFVLFQVQEGRTPSKFRFLAIEANPVLEEINGLSEYEIVGKDATEIFPTADPEIIDILCEVSISGLSARFERYKEDINRYFEVIAFRPREELCAALVTDITHRKQAEASRQRSEFRIRQTQKMEAIGRLASGVAHDFNNILTAIFGLTNVLLEEIPKEWPQWGDLEEIRKAADRAASLTRQLLAFSRKQEISPKVINLNKTVEQSLRMLSRIMGEDIQLMFNPLEDLKPVEIDPSQVEQILANFSANSRDAMPKGGKLCLNTRNETVAESRLTTHGEIQPGNYVVITAEDNGTGMSDEVQERLFEPFFTTKGKGKGTGLGLATVYGIVRQNKGTIIVHSELGKGTTFEIFLPQAITDADETEREAPKAIERGSGTVLVAEDEDTVRNLTVRLLKRHGYTVLAAPNGESAYQLWKTHKGQIDVLLTDVIMPGMNGVELYQRLKKSNANMKVLYMSGYPEDVIQDHGMTAEDMTLLEKPFAPNELMEELKKIYRKKG